ncbi:MAG: hypothetical protein K2O67_05335 [Clostridia bacterium]|nr:hypothetical protein [Clostridia bacterium]
MKKIVNFTMCLVLCLLAMFAIIPQRQEATQTKYFATSFNGASEFTTKVFTVSYAERVPSGKTLALRTPDYIVPNVTCVPIAGANILGFYDRYYTELIPNFTPGVTYAGVYYVYNAYDDNVTNAALQLAADMGLTDPAKQGATVAGCKTGFEKYCNIKSLSVSFDSTMQNNSLNYETAKEQLNSGKPIIIFCSYFNLATMGQNGKTDTIVLYTSTTPHAMVAFGYSEYTYTLSDGSTRVDKYLEVASGVDTLSSAMVYMGSDLTVDDAYAVTIY